MSQPPVYIIFWGSYWDAHPADQGTLLLAAAGVITSPFPHIVDQYGADGSNMVIGNWTVDNSDPPSGNFDDGNIDDVINNQIDNHTFPDSDSSPKPIYVVVTPPGVLSDNPKAAGFNIVKGVFSDTPEIWCWSGRNGDGTINVDNFSLTFSHEIAEIMSDFDGEGYEVNTPPNWHGGGDDQIGDKEGNSYSFRMPGGVDVQPVWSRADNAWAVNDGTTQKFNLTPDWTLDTFFNDYTLNLVGDQAGLGQNDDITIGSNLAGGVSVTLNGETMNFDKNYIKAVNIDTKTGVTNTVHVNALPVNIPLSITSTGGFVTLVGADSSNQWDITGANQGTVNGYSFTRATRLIGGSLDDTFTFKHGGLLDGDVDGIDGGGGTNTIIAPDDNNFWSIMGKDSGALDLHASYTNVQNLTGGGNGDFFNFLGSGSVSGTLDAGGFNNIDRNILDFTDSGSPVSVNIGAFSASVIHKFAIINEINGSLSSDTLTATFSDSLTIDGLNQGITFGIVFRSFENLVGTSGNSFIFKPGGSISGNLDGGLGSAATLDYHNLAGPITVDFSTGKASGIGGTFTHITKVIGSQSSSDTIVGPDAQWDITAPDAGTVNDIAFSSFENLKGPAGPDTFSFYPGGFISGNIDGGTGNNTLDYSQLSSPVSLDLTHGTATGIGGTFSNITGFVGGSGQNNVVGPDAATHYTIFGPNQVAFAGLSFSNFQNINAGSFADTFSFLTGGSLDGKIDGGAGINLLTYAGYIGDVIVNLQLHSASAVNGGIFNIRNVVGAAGNSLLVGDANDNTLRGGTGRNIFVGGAGADRLVGGGGDNILIGDSTIYDLNPAALTAIFKEWIRTDLSFEQRVADLISAGDNRRSLNGSYNFNKPSIISDISIDSLVGTNGLDWFFETKKQDGATGVTSADHVTQV